MENGVFLDFSQIETMCSDPSFYNEILGILYESRDYNVRTMYGGLLKSWLSFNWLELGRNLKEIIVNSIIGLYSDNQNELEYSILEFFIVNYSFEPVWDDLYDIFVQFVIKSSIDTFLYNIKLWRIVCKVFHNDKWINHYSFGVIFNKFTDICGLDINDESKIQIIKLFSAFLGENIPDDSQALFFFEYCLTILSNFVENGGFSFSLVGVACRLETTLIRHSAYNHLFVLKADKAVQCLYKILYHLNSSSNEFLLSCILRSLYLLRNHIEFCIEILLLHLEFCSIPDYYFDIFVNNPLEFYSSFYQIDISTKMHPQILNQIMIWVICESSNECLDYLLCLEPSEKAFRCFRSVCTTTVHNNRINVMKAWIMRSYQHIQSILDLTSLLFLLNDSIEFFRIEETEFAFDCLLFGFSLNNEVTAMASSKLLLILVKKGFSIDQNLVGDLYSLYLTSKWNCLIKLFTKLVLIVPEAFVGIVQHFCDSLMNEINIEDEISMNQSLNLISILITLEPIDIPHELVELCIKLLCDDDIEDKSFAENIYQGLILRKDPYAISMFPGYIQMITNASLESFSKISLAFLSVHQSESKFIVSDIIRFFYTIPFDELSPQCMDLICWIILIGGDVDFCFIDSIVQFLHQINNPIFIVLSCEIMLAQIIVGTRSNESMIREISTEIFSNQWWIRLYDKKLFLRYYEQFEMIDEANIIRTEIAKQNSTTSQIYMSSLINNGLPVAFHDLFDYPFPSVLDC